MLDETAELPMFALTFTRATFPMAIGSSLPARWWMLAGMVSRPRAISSRITSAGTCSRSATMCIGSVISPWRAWYIWVGQARLIIRSTSAGINRIRFKGCVLSPCNTGHPRLQAI